MSTDSASVESGNDNAAMPAPQLQIEDTLMQSVSWLCDHYGVGRSPQALTAGLPKVGLLTPSLALASMTNAGLSAGLVERQVRALPEQLFPIILLRQGRGGCVLVGRREAPNAEDKRACLYQVILPEISTVPVEISQAEMDELYSGFAILAKRTAKVDTRAGEETARPAGHWLLSTLWRYRRYYRSAAIGAVLINVLGLASIFFTMNVYDRVVPNQAFVTLWSLAIGVVVAMVFEAVARYVRAHLLDLAGKKADLVLGTMLFRQALSIQMEHKPASSGSFANQLREFESVRDFATSATLAAISDLPFVLMFVAVIFVVGGPLGWVPMLLIPLIILISIGIQWPLARTMKENLRESSLKQGVLIESIEGLETLKAVGGETLNAQATNLLRLGDESVRGSLERRIAVSEEAGALAARAGAAGIGGGSLEMVSRANAMRAQRVTEMSRVITEQQADDGKLAMEQTMRAVVLGLDDTQFDTSLNFMESVASKTPRVDWGTAAVKAGMEGMQAYSSMGGSFGAKAPTTSLPQQSPAAWAPQQSPAVSTSPFGHRPAPTIRMK